MSNTIADNLQRLTQAKSDIADAITAKGGTVNEGDGFEEFSADIASIPSGGGGTFENISAKIACKTNVDCQNTSIPIDTSYFETFSWTNLPTINTSTLPITNFTGYGESIWTDGERIFYSMKVSGVYQHYILDSTTGTWELKTWNGYTDFEGAYIWTDGEHIFYSYDTTHYILDRTTDTWSALNWTSSFYATYIFSDATDIYYGYNGRMWTTYKLDKSTLTWTYIGALKPGGDQYEGRVSSLWKSPLTGITYYSDSWQSSDTGSFTANTCVFYSGKLYKNTSTAVPSSVYTSSSYTDDDAIYATRYSSRGTTTIVEYLPHRVVISTGGSVTWNDGTISSINGDNLWTDGNQIFYSSGSTQYVLSPDKKTFNSTSSSDLTAKYIWSDGTHIYYSYGSNQYVLDKSTNTWISKVWNGLQSFNGDNVWTDGTHIYYSRSKIGISKSCRKYKYATMLNEKHYILNTNTNTWELKVWNGFTDFNGKDIWTDGSNIYCSHVSKHYILNTLTDTWDIQTWTGLNYTSGMLSVLLVGRMGIDFTNNNLCQYVDGHKYTRNGNSWSTSSSAVPAYPCTEIWCTDNFMYCSSGVQLNPISKTWLSKTWTGDLLSFDGAYIWSDGSNIFYSCGTEQYKLHQ